MLRKYITIALIILSTSSLLSEREWSSFFPEKQKHGLINIVDDDDIFYWLFPSRSDADSDPLIIWLTGGPGCSSELAVFVENGPMNLVNGEAVSNPNSWSNKANLLFIDQPIGTGFSKGSIFNMPKNEEKVREQFGIFIKKFYKLYPELKNRKLYITGESYAGHYIPFIADFLIEEESFKTEGITLSGVAIGNGWVMPYDQYSGYPSFAYNNELINIIGKYALEGGFELCKLLVKYQIPVLNQYVCNILTQSVLGLPTAPRFNIYDIRRKCDFPPLCYDFSQLDVFLNREDVQEELGVPGRKWQSCNMEVHLALFNDFEVNAAPKVSNLLNKGVQVLVYNGDKDYICNWEGSQVWVNNLEWYHTADFVQTQMTKIEGGEIKNFENFTFFRIYDAGHMVPMDQPEVGLRMINKFIGAEN